LELALHLLMRGLSGELHLLIRSLLGAHLGGFVCHACPLAFSLLRFREQSLSG
jgi:hypothetical protein